MTRKPTDFRPGVALTLATLVALAILITLGTWQAAKVGPKTTLLAAIAAGLAAEPMELPVHLDDPTTLEYRRVRFEGTLGSQPPIRVFATDLKGKPGYHVYMPVTRRFGMAVLVNFGWIPMNHAGPVNLPMGEDITVTGVLRLSATPGSMTPPNEPAKGNWFTADVHEMAAAFGLRTKEYYHFRVFADAGVLPSALPVGGQVRIDIPNDHLEYAFTWYGLGAALLGVYLVFGFKRGREKR